MEYRASLRSTSLSHIPLNDELVAAGKLADIDDIGVVRDDFATPWVAWDIVRILASIATFGCLAWALVLWSGRAEATGARG